MRDLDLTDLLRGAERPRRLTVDERARLDAEFERAMSTRLGGRALPTGQSGAPGHGRRRSAWVAAATAAAAAVVLVVAIVSAGSDAPQVSDQPGSLPGSTLPTPCPPAVEVLVAGLDQWGDVDNWAFSGEAQPDLSVLLVDAFEVLETLGESSAPSASQRYESDFAEVDDGVLPLLVTESNGRAEVMRRGLDELAALLGTPAAAGCRLPEL